MRNFARHISTSSKEVERLVTQLLVFLKDSSLLLINIYMIVTVDLNILAPVTFRKVDKTKKF